MAKKIRNREIAAAQSEIERSKLVDMKTKQERAAEKERAAAIKKVNEEQARFKEAIANVAKTEDGKIFFRMLRRSCGVDQFACQIVPPATVATDLMLINNSKRDLWLDISKLIPTKDLIAIEYGIKVVATSIEE